MSRSLLLQNFNFYPHIEETILFYEIKVTYSILVNIVCYRLNVFQNICKYISFTVYRDTVKNRIIKLWTPRQQVHSNYIKKLLNVQICLSYSYIIICMFNVISCLLSIKLNIIWVPIVIDLVYQEQTTTSTLIWKMK